MNIVPKRAILSVTTGVMSCLIQPQNGGEDPPMHCRSQFDMGPAMDARNGNVGPVETPKRPKNLEVLPANGFAKKGLRTAEDGDVDGGGSPELLSDSEGHGSGCPEADEALNICTRQLVCQTLRNHTGCLKPAWSESKALATMKRVVADVLEKHKYSYNGMVNKLSLDNRENDVSFVSAVAKSLFSDGTTNWGRITSLVAFGAVVCQHLRQRGSENCEELVAQEISSYLLSDQRDWLVKNNSWDGFVEFFQVADPESTVRNTLMAFAGFAGLGATLALLIR